MIEIDNLTADQAVNQIEQLCKTKKSGTIFLVTENKIMGQIKLTEGEIVAAHYPTKTGMDALKKIFESVNMVLFKFIENNKLATQHKVDPDLPPLAHILGAIKNTGQSTERIVSKDIAKVSKIVISELSLHIGPMATIVCEEYFKNAKYLSDIMGSLDAIASNIDNAAKEAKFKRLVSEKIQGLVVTQKTEQRTKSVVTYDITQHTELVISELSLYIGPMATIVCEEYFKDAKYLSDIMGSLDAIASNIDNAAKEAKFKRLVIEKIQNI